MFIHSDVELERFVVSGVARRGRNRSAVEHNSGACRGPTGRPTLSRIFRRPYFQTLALLDEWPLRISIGRSGGQCQNRMFSDAYA